MPYRNKVYVCFDGDNDIRYYWLMLAWKQNDNTSFSFFDAHDLNSALDTSLEETIKRKLRERLRNAKTFVVLIGESTQYSTNSCAGRWSRHLASTCRLSV